MTFLGRNAINKNSLISIYILPKIPARSHLVLAKKRGGVNFSWQHYTVIFFLNFLLTNLCVKYYSERTILYLNRFT